MLPNDVAERSQLLAHRGSSHVVRRHIIPMQLSVRCLSFEDDELLCGGTRIDFSRKLRRQSAFVCDLARANREIDRLREARPLLFVLFE